MSNSLQFELASIIADEIKNNQDVIDGYHINVELNGNMTIKLMCRVPGSTTILTSHEALSCSEIIRTAYPKDWIKFKINVMINSLKIRLERKI